MSTFLIEAPRLPLRSQPCRGCGRPIYWVITQAGKKTCLDRYIEHGSDGRYVRVEAEDTHWATCVARAQFTRTKTTGVTHA